MQVVDVQSRHTAPEPRPDTDLPLPSRLLAAIAIDYASFATFVELEEPGPFERTFERVVLGESHDIWLIRWGAESRTELHDHGGSAGVLYVVNGALVEHRPNPTGIGRPLRRHLHEFDYQPMSTSHVHSVANESATTATSVHVYSPPLTTMQHFEPRDDSQLRRLQREVVTGTLESDGSSANG